MVTPPTRAGRLPEAGPHGGDAAAVALALGLDPDDVLDLSQSLNPVAPDPVPIVGRHMGALRRYPDAKATTQLLAMHMGADADRLLLTNGGSEAIALVASELGGSVVEPEFALHPRGTGPRWRSNPQNPTGLLAAPGESAEVWDEAFFPLATGQWTRGDASAVVVGSLTKLFACPGLRLGYVLGDPDLVTRCRRRQPEWSVNSLALAALPDFLTLVDLGGWSTEVAALRTQLCDALAGYGLVSRPSDANWLLVEHPSLRTLLAPHGVVVRDCSSFGLPGLTRVAVPSSEGLERLVAALRRIDLEVPMAQVENGQR